MEATTVLSTVLNLVYELSTEWQPLGTLLGLDQSSLRSIQMQNPSSPSNCLIAVLDRWIQSSPKPGPYWEQLEAAVSKLQDVSEAKKVAETIKLYCRMETGLTPIEPQLPISIINSILTAIAKEFPNDTNALLQLKLIAKSLLAASSDVDSEKIEKSDQPVDIFLMISEKFPADVGAIVYDILCTLGLKDLITSDYDVICNAVCNQLTSRNYMFAKYLLRIAQNLTSEEASKIVSLTSINYNLNLDPSSTTGIQLLYTMVSLRMVTSAHVTRLYRLLLVIDREDMAEELKKYLQETGQEPIAEVVFQSVMKPFKNIKIMPIMRSESIAEINKTTPPIQESYIRTLIKQIVEKLDAIQQERNDDAMKKFQDELAKQKLEYEEKISKEIEALSAAMKMSLEGSSPSCYEISPTATNRGYALIINNFRFTSQDSDNAKRLPQRFASEIDEANMTQLLGIRMGYQPVVYSNVTHNDLKTDIEHYTKVIRDDHDSFVCMVFSWGCCNHFYTSNGVLLDASEDILPYLSVPSLRGKPKIVFVCTIQNHATTGIVSAVKPVNMIDTLLVCATLSSADHVTTEYGSPYIQTLFQVLFNKCVQNDLVSMLTMVNHELVIKSKPVQQIVMSSLTKQMRFFKEESTTTSSIDGATDKSE